MTWLEMYRRGGLPLGAKEAHAIALDRMQAGEHVGPKARAKANRLLGLLEEERRSRADTDWEAHDRWLRENGRAPSRPGAGVSPSSAPRSTARSTGIAPGGGSALPTRTASVNARMMSDQEYRQYLAARGLDANFGALRGHNELSMRQPPTSSSLAVRLAMARQQRQAREKNEARTATLQSGAINAREEKDGRKVANRVAEILGPNADAQILGSFRPGGDPLPPPTYDETTPAKRMAAAEKHVRKLEAAAVRRGTPLDTRQLSAEEFAAWKQMKGLTNGYQTGGDGYFTGR